MTVRTAANPGIDPSWSLDPALLELLSPFDRGFLETELARPEDYYRRRVRRLGWRGLPRVLDLACGIGQWSVALARENGRVDAVDISTARLMAARGLAAGMGATNVSVAWADMHRTPFADASFDAVLCNIALMYGNVPRVLREIARILRPGGSAYLNAAGWGYYLHSLVEQGLRTRELRWCARMAKLLVRSAAGRRDNVALSRGRLVRFARRAGLEVVHVGPEGSWHSGEQVAVALVYPATHYGITGVFECVCRKPGGAPA